MDTQWRIKWQRKRKIKEILGLYSGFGSGLYGILSILGLPRDQ